MVHAVHKPNTNQISPPLLPTSLVQYSGADDSYYDDGSGSGTGAYGYDEYANDYEAGNDDGFEMAPVSSSAGAGRGFGGWFGRGSAKPSAAPIEW